MLRHVRTAALAHLAAALVAASLSGAPRLLAMHAPVEGHRCSCRARAGGHHDCDCAICRKAALSAQASDETQPPCHRAAARKALEENTGGRGLGDAPCVDGTCGNGGGHPPTIAGLEPFCLPLEGSVTPAPETEASPPPGDPAHERVSEPETPPPRAA